MPAALAVNLLAECTSNGPTDALDHPETRPSRSAGRPPGAQPAGGSEADVGDVDVAEEFGPGHPVRVHELEAPDDVLGPVEVEPVVAGETLEGLRGEDVALRVSP